MGQACRVGSRKHPTGPMPQYQQEERRFCTCYSANLQSQSPPFVLGQQWLCPLLLGRDGQVLPGRSQWLYIIDVSHRWAPFFSPLGHWLEKTSTWSPRCDQWQPGPSWNLTAGGENSMAPLLSLTPVFGWRRFPSLFVLFVYLVTLIWYLVCFGFSLLFFSPFILIGQRVNDKRTVMHISITPVYRGCRELRHSYYDGTEMSLECEIKFFLLRYLTYETYC